MPIVELLALPIVVVLLFWAIERAGLSALLAIVTIAALYGLGVDLSISQIGRAFGAGFGQAVANVGLVVIAGAVVAAVATERGAIDALARWLPPRTVGAIAAAIGAIGGLGNIAPAAFAALSPVRRAMTKGGVAAIGAMALGLVLAHGLLPPAPGPIAAAAILSVSPFRVVAVGLPALLIGLVVAVWWARRFKAPLNGSTGEFGLTQRGPVLVVIVPVMVMLAVLVIQSLGQIPSEPLGRAGVREWLIGIGRAPVLLALGVGLVLLLNGRRDRATLGDQGLVGRAIIQAMPAVLLVGGAGGIEKLLQETGAPELTAEMLINLRLGVAVPFLVAAVLKTLQGSSLVAVIAAAGMIEPALAGLGLASDWGRALAAAAVGLGATTVLHINDPMFWQVQVETGLRPSRTMALVSVGGLMQALAALAILAALAQVLA